MVRTALQSAVGPLGVPVVPLCTTRPSAAELAHVDPVAKQFVAEVAMLSGDERYHAVELQSAGEGPALHLDDFSAIHVPNFLKSMDSLQDRARLRAGDGDFVAAAQPHATGYEEY